MVSQLEIWRAEFEFGIRLSFICVEILGSYWGHKIPKRKMAIFTIFPSNFDPKNGS